VTPLAERLSTLEPRLAAFRRDSLPGQASFLILFTDGAPTPPDSGRPTTQAAQAALRTLRRLTHEYPVRLVCRLCTDESTAVEFWNEADAETELPLDVLDDVEGEAAEIAKCGNGWLAYSPELHLLRESGTFVGLLDLLDERRLRPGEAATLAGLLLDGGEHPLPDWQHQPAEFARALEERAAAAGSAYDARKRTMVPIVDAVALQKAVSSKAAMGEAQPMVLVGVLVLVAAIMLMLTLSEAD